MTKPHYIVALTGPANCGKDTAADLLATHCGFTKLAFADPLRSEVSEAFGIEPLYLTRRETKEHPMSALALNKCRSSAFVDRMVATGVVPLEDVAKPRSPRQIMQWWGTNYRRVDMAQYWASQTRDRINFMLRQHLSTRFVITDCRFPNEAAMVQKDFHGVLWQITRPGVSVADGAHVSETTGAEFEPDAVIDNDGDVLQLREKVLSEFWAYEAGLDSLKVEIEA